MSDPSTYTGALVPFSPELAEDGAWFAELLDQVERDLAAVLERYLVGPADPVRIVAELHHRPPAGRQLRRRRPVELLTIELPPC